MQNIEQELTWILSDKEVGMEAEIDKSSVANIMSMITIIAMGILPPMKQVVHYGVKGRFTSLNLLFTTFSLIVRNDWESKLLPPLSNRFSIVKSYNIEHNNSQPHTQSHRRIHN